MLYSFELLFTTFIAFSIFGWIYEVIWTLIQDRKLVNRGFLNGPYCPIYGAGSILLIALQFFTTRPIELFFLGGLVCCALEYIVSFSMEKIFKARWWDYKKYPFNINGRVCLYGFLVFGAFSVILSLIYPPFVQIIKSVPTMPLHIACAVVFILFVLDIISSTSAIVHLNRMLKEYQKQLKHNGFVRLISDHSRKLIMFLTRDNRYARAFSKQQKRIIKAFPRFRSTKYQEALESLSRASKEMKKKYKETKHQPEIVITEKDIKHHAKGGKK